MPWARSRRRLGGKEMMNKFQELADAEVEWRRGYRRGNLAKMPTGFMPTVKINGLVVR